MRKGQRRILVWLTMGVAGLVVVAGAATTALGKLGSRTTEIPSARVERGTLDQILHVKGEIRTTQSTMLLAPSVSRGATPGAGSMRILSLMPTASPVKKGELMLSFDTAEQEYQLALAQSQLREAEYEIEKLTAGNTVQAAKDKVDLLTARYDVRGAELGTRGNDLVGRVEARKNELTLEEARRKLEELEQNVRERTATSRAALDVAREKRNKALIAIEQAERNIAKMEIRAPFDGVVLVRENADAGIGFNYPGAVLPDYAEGDMVGPGRPIAEVLDATKLEILAKAPESAGATVAAGQRAEVTVNGRRGRTYRARVKTVSAVASRGGTWWNNGVGRQFDVTLQLEGKYDELKPGQTLQVKIDAEPLEKVLHAPRQAVFNQRGATVVYVRSGNGFEEREVKVIRRTETRAALEGLEDGVEVALINPEEGAASPVTPPNPTAPLGAS